VAEKASSLNSDDVFVLETPSKTYLWNGVVSLELLLLTMELASSKTLESIFRLLLMMKRASELRLPIWCLPVVIWYRSMKVKSRKSSGML
jgi:hypothetical protein